MFSTEEKEEIIAERNETIRIDLNSESHNTHLDATAKWIQIFKIGYKYIVKTVICSHSAHYRFFYSFSDFTLSRKQMNLFTDTSYQNLH